MIDVERLAELIKKAEMPSGEREAWVKLIPMLSADDLEGLMEILQSEQDQLAELRQEYLKKAQAIVDSED